MFVDGSEIKKEYIFQVLSYILKFIFNSKKSHEEVALEKEYIGKGDNIRITVRK